MLLISGFISSEICLSEYRYFAKTLQLYDYLSQVEWNVDVLTHVNKYASSKFHVFRFSNTFLFKFEINLEITSGLFPYSIIK